MSTVKQLLQDKGHEVDDQDADTPFTSDGQRSDSQYHLYW